MPVVLPWNERRRRLRRDPVGVAKQVRVGRRARGDRPRPAAFHVDELSGRLRLHRGHARRGRRPARRARARRRADVPGLPDPRPRGRHVPHDRRERAGREDHLRPAQGSRLDARSPTSTTCRPSFGTRSSTSSRCTRISRTRRPRLAASAIAPRPSLRSRSRVRQRSEASSRSIARTRCRRRHERTPTKARAPSDQRARAAAAGGCEHPRAEAALAGVGRGAAPAPRSAGPFTRLRLAGRRELGDRIPGGDLPPAAELLRLGPERPGALLRVPGLQQDVESDVARDTSS